MEGVEYENVRVGASVQFVLWKDPCQGGGIKEGVIVQIQKCRRKQWNLHPISGPDQDLPPIKNDGKLKEVRDA